MTEDNTPDRISGLEWSASAFALLLFMAAMGYMLILGIIDDDFWDINKRPPVDQIFILVAITFTLLRVLGGVKSVPQSTYRSAYLFVLGLLAVVSTYISALLALHLENVLVLGALLVTMISVSLGWAGVLGWNEIQSRLGKPFLFITIGSMAVGLLGLIVSFVTVRLWCGTCPAICDVFSWIAAISQSIILVSILALLCGMQIKGFGPGNTGEATQ